MPPDRSQQARSGRHILPRRGVVRRLFHRASGKQGASPGTLIHLGERRVEQVRIQVFDYDADRFQEREAAKIEEVFPFRDSPTITWINIDGLHETSVIEAVGTHYQIHPLVLEDILNTNQRPKVEDFEDYLYVVLKMFQFGSDGLFVHSEQVSLILQRNIVISFQEKPGDVLDPLRDRIRTGKGRIRKSGADYLAYSILDGIVDSYFQVLERIGDGVDEVEEAVLEEPGRETVLNIHRLRRELLFVKRAVWPLREVISALARGDSLLIGKDTRIFLRDVYDHTIQVIESVETLRDMVTGMQDIYLSSVSNRMNNVMKVLTVIATMFIPLTFVTGLYGMNFDNMPELHWRYGYYTVLGAMAALLVVMAAWFRHKDWI